MAKLSNIYALGSVGIKVTQEMTPFMYSLLFDAKRLLGNNPLRLGGPMISVRPVFQIRIDSDLSSELGKGPINSINDSITPQPGA
jgi:hypothetical protein